MNKRISIITVSYNSENTIKDTIESVLNQSYDNYEYIIMDGLSTDGTVDIANSYADKFSQKNIPFTVISEKDSGIYDAMNKGISAATGDIIGIINSDDYYELIALEKVNEFYNKVPYDIMYADLNILGSGKTIRKVSKHTKTFNTRYWNHPTTFVTRGVYDKHKYICESIYDDLDFVLWARNSGYKFEILNEILANFRLGGVSNEVSFKKTRERLKLKNGIYKKHNCRRYKFNNFIMEYGKYFFTKYIFTKGRGK